MNATPRQFALALLALFGWSGWALLSTEQFLMAAFGIATIVCAVKILRRGLLKRRTDLRNPLVE